MKKTWIIRILTITMLIPMISFKAVGAKATDVLVQGKDKKQYQYNIDELVDSFVDTKVLYNDFLNRGTAIAYYDVNSNQYVDVEKIVDAFVEDSKSFDIDTFTENALTNDCISSDEKIIILSEKNGIVQQEKVIDIENIFDVKSIY